MPVLARPFTRAERAFDINLGAFLQEPLDHIDKVLVEYDDAVPFGLLLALAGCFIFPAVAGGHSYGRDLAGLHGPHLRICAQIPEQTYFVHASSHFYILLFYQL